MQARTEHLQLLVLGLSHVKKKKTGSTHLSHDLKYKKYKEKMLINNRNVKFILKQLQQFFKCQHISILC